MKKIIILVVFFLALVVLFVDWKFFKQECGDCAPTINQAAMVKIFFPNTSTDPNFLDCSKVDFVERNLPTGDSLPKEVVESLLAGPTEQEKSLGYFTSINSGVGVEDLEINSGVATISLTKNIEEGVGGSCRVGSIRSQIENTLKQFPEIKEVVIKIDGRTEDILQP